MIRNFRLCERRSLGGTAGLDTDSNNEDKENAFACLIHVIDLSIAYRPERSALTTAEPSAGMSTLVVRMLYLPSSQTVVDSRRPPAI